MGFGCGDQTIYLSRQAFVDPQTSIPKPDHPKLGRYAGITLDKKQYYFATQHLHEHGIRSDQYDVRVFCADAAKPSSWSTELLAAVNARMHGHEKWVLALDTLYHFSPSRWPIINYAYGNLHASLMAFDLVLADDASLFSWLLLVIICLLSGCPVVNFVTAREYRRQLVSAGYAEEKIEIRDISEHVFEPLTRFLEERERQLGMIGLGIGGFRVARWMFGWWAKNGVVRAVIVIARR